MLDRGLVFFKDLVLDISEGLFFFFNSLLVFFEKPFFPGLFWFELIYLHRQVYDLLLLLALFVG